MIRRLGVVLLAACVAVGLPAVGDEKKDKEPAEKGWVKLFNGKDLKGWKTHEKYPGKWTVKENILVSTGKVSHLYSERGDFKNFHVRAEVKINDKGNSGLYVR